MFRNLQAGCLGVSANLDRAIELAQVGGFGGIDFPAAEVAALADQDKLGDVRQKLKAADLRFGGFGMPVNFRGDEETFAKGLSELPRLASAARELGVTRTYTWIAPASDDRSFAENFDFHASRLRPIAELLAEYGISFGLEFIGPATLRQGKQHEFVHTIDGMMDLCRAIDTGNCGLLMDCWHWYTSHATVADIEKLRAADIVYVHVNDAPAGIPIDEQVDNVRCLPSATGVIDIAGFLRALQKIGYDGPVTPEPFSKSLNALPDDEAVAQTGTAMAQIWAQAGI